MKRKEYLKNLQSKRIEDLSKDLLKEKQKYDDMRLELCLGKLKNYSSLSHQKKNIARLDTIINSKAEILIAKNIKPEETS